MAKFNLTKYESAGPRAPREFLDDGYCGTQGVPTPLSKPRDQVLSELNEVNGINKRMMVDREEVQKQTPTKRRADDCLELTTGTEQSIKRNSTVADHHDDLAKLKLIIKDQHDQLSKVDATVNELSARLIAKEIELRCLEDNLEQFKANSDRLENLLEAKNKYIEANAVKLDKANSQVEELETIIKLTNYMSAVYDEGNEFDKQRAELIAVKADNEYLSNQLNEIKKGDDDPLTIERLFYDKVISSAKERKELLAHNEQLKIHLEAMTRANEDLKEHSNVLTSELDTVRKEKYRLEQRIIELNVEPRRSRRQVQVVVDLGNNSCMDVPTTNAPPPIYVCDIPVEDGSVPDCPKAVCKEPELGSKHERVGENSGLNYSSLNITTDAEEMEICEQTLKQPANEDVLTVTDNGHADCEYVYRGRKIASRHEFLTTIRSELNSYTKRGSNQYKCKLIKHTDPKTKKRCVRTFPLTEQGSKSLKMHLERTHLKIFCRHVNVHGQVCRADKMVSGCQRKPGPFVSSTFAKHCSNDWHVYASN